MISQFINIDNCSYLHSDPGSWSQLAKQTNYSKYLNTEEIHFESQSDVSLLKKKNYPHAYRSANLLKNSIIPTTPWTQRSYYLIQLLNSHTHTIHSFTLLLLNKSLPYLLTYKMNVQFNKLFEHLLWEFIQGRSGKTVANNRLVHRRLRHSICHQMSLIIKLVQWYQKISGSRLVALNPGWAFVSSGLFFFFF